jgi:hypothetical protein
MGPKLAALAAAGALCACAAPKEPSESKGDPFDSTRLVIQMGGMRLLDGWPAIQVALKNKTSEPLWVAAVIDAPGAGQDCELFERIDSAASQLFSCRQVDLVYDEVYALRFDVFADEARSELLEQQSTELLFGSEFRVLLEAARAAREQGP